MKHLEKLFYDSDWTPPEIIYGNNLIPKVTGKGKYVVATMEIPWNLVKEDVVAPPRKVIFVRDMSLETLKAIEREVPEIDFVIGLGGGSSHDTAKYIALKRQVPLIQIPTIISSDASVTNAIGVRENRKVKYIGHVYIDKLIIDFALLKKAPKELIRYGSADILSSHTAIFDWKLSSQNGRAKFNKVYYEEAKNILQELKKNKSEIYSVTEKGIKKIVELYLNFARIENKQANSRAQEGSEHFFAYNSEYVTKRTFVHGKLLSLGIEIISYIQKNEFEKTMALMEDLGIKTFLSDLKINREEFISIMTSLKNFVEKTPYYYSILNEVEISTSFANNLYNIFK